MQSCGIGDVIATSFGGRNRKCAEAFVERALQGYQSQNIALNTFEAARFTQELWKNIESELLSGQKLQGLGTALEVVEVLNHYENNRMKKQQETGGGGEMPSFPLMRKVQAISTGKEDPKTLFVW